MTRVETRALKFFLNKYCSIAFYSDKRGSWTNEGRSSYSLTFLFSGALRDKSTGIKLLPGTFLLENPGTSSTLTARNASLLGLEIGSALILDGAVRTRLGTRTSVVSLQAGECLKDESLSRLIDNLASEMTQAQAGHEAVISAVVEQVVIQLLRRYSVFRRQDALELSRVGLIDRRIRRAVELMVAQLDQDVSLKEMAAACYLSPFHFARLFKKLTGTTPHSYLASLRISEAKRLLSQTDLSVSQIGLRVGYLSASHFSKGFRQASGSTPRDFRASLISRHIAE